MCSLWVYRRKTMTPSKKTTLLIFFAGMVIAICCIAGMCLVYPGLPASSNTTEPTPILPTDTAPSLSEVPFAIDDHTSILPTQNIGSADFLKKYGHVNVPDGAKDIVYLTFNQPVSKFDDVLALDFTIYGEPFHRILKKTSFNLYSDIVTYEGRLNTSDPSTTFWITFGPSNLVHTDIPWQDSAIEVLPIQNKNFTESTEYPLHIACRQPGWDERMQDPEFANDPWVQWVNAEREKYANDPTYQPEYYWELFLVSSHYTPADTGVTVVRFEETDFQKFPELRELAENPNTEIRLSQKTYDEQTYKQYLVQKFFTFPGNDKVIIDVDGTYYEMGSTIGRVTPWDP